MKATDKTILLVDDDRDDRYLFNEAISSAGQQVNCHLAESGRAALELLSNVKPNLPSVIFLDVNMPEMNGWQVLQKIKADKEFNNIPVIMYSTSSHTRDISMALESGALCFCVKPDRFSDLQKLVHEVCNSLDDLTKIEKSALKHFHFTPPESGTASAPAS
jgi:CheY-like chemotaxis protein